MSKHDLNGLHVTSFESRRAKEIEKLIKYHGGVPRVAPSMREVPLSESTEAIEFGTKLIEGNIDIVVFFTGVGTRALRDAVITKYPEEEFSEALKKVTIVARGPKPVSALREMGLNPNIMVPEPNTWRDVLSAIDLVINIENKRVAVQEYGITNEEFLEGLKSRGADVLPVPVYKWEMPEDLTPLTDAIESISKGNEDIALFTSSQQVYNLFQVAKDHNMEEELRAGFKDVLIGSVGPTTTEALSRFNLSTDYEPNSPKMGNLLLEIARTGPGLLNKKRIAHTNNIDTSNWRRVDMEWTNNTKKSRKDITKDSVFMKACRREEVPYTPVWLMRQAGRYMREYRDIRSRVSFLELCKTPELAAEVTISAAERIKADAAIIFADILLILEPLGIDIEFSKGQGPKILNPITGTIDVENLIEFDPEALDYVYNSLSITRRALNPETALIGFAGAPFTIASYAIEGGGSRNYVNTKTLMYNDPSAWHQLMTKLTEATAQYLNTQIKAGADALQLFDSWVGSLSPDDYQEYVLPHMKKLLKKIKKGVPVIHFGTATGSLLEMIKETGSPVIGLDWRVDLKEAWQRIGHDVAVQGNIDPLVLFSTPSEIRSRVHSILDKAEGRPGHIFNLGHGILPKTPVENVFALIDAVHELSAR